MTFITTKTGELILIAIGVIVLVAFLIFLGMDYVRALLDQFFGDETTEEAYFREAIECAYYRCVDGCGNLPDKVKDYEFPTPPNGELKRCKEDFCDNVPDVFKDDNKICDNNAKQYPVEVYIEDEIKVSKDRLKDASCIADEESEFDFNTAYNNRWFIFFEKTLITDINREDCDLVVRLGIDNAVKDAKFSDTGYIYTYVGVPPIDNKPLMWTGTKTTLIDDESLYIELKSGVEEEITFDTEAEYPTGFEDGPSYRIVIKEDSTIVSEAALTLEEYDAVQGGPLKISLTVGDTTKEEEFYEDDTKSLTFDDEIYTLTLDEIDQYVDWVKFKIKYTGPPTVSPETCADVGGACDRPSDCTDGYECYASQLDCTEYPTTCCCVPIGT